MLKFSKAILEMRLSPISTDAFLKCIDGDYMAIAFGTNGHSLHRVDQTGNECVSNGEYGLRIDVVRNHQKMRAVLKREEDQKLCQGKMLKGDNPYAIRRAAGVEVKEFDPSILDEDAVTIEQTEQPETEVIEIEEHTISMR